MENLTVNDMKEQLEELIIENMDLEKLLVFGNENNDIVEEDEYVDSRNYWLDNDGAFAYFFEYGDYDYFILTLPTEDMEFCFSSGKAAVHHIEERMGRMCADGDFDFITSYIIKDEESEMQLVYEMCGFDGSKTEYARLRGARA